MAQVLFFVPGNLAFHGNLQPAKRNQLLTELPLWLQAFENSGLPVLLSLQGIDVALSQLSLADYTLDWCRAPYGHLLPSLFEGTPWQGHVNWNFQAGSFAGANTDITFSPEFDIPREGAEQIRKRSCHARGPSSSWNGRPTFTALMTSTWWCP
jgi:hypothetical protein